MKEEKKLISALALIQFTHILDFVILMPLGPQLIRVLGISTGEFSLLISSYTFSAALSGIVLSSFIDRFPRKKALSILYLVFSLATLGCGLSLGYKSFLLMRLIAGGSGGILNGILLTIIGDEVGEQRRGRAIGAVMSSFSVASIVGVPCGLLLATSFDFRAPFLALSLLSFSVWFYLQKAVVLSDTRSKISTIQTPPEKVSLSSFSVGLCATFFLMVSGYSIVPFVSTSLVANAGVEEASLFYVYFCAGLVSFFTSRAFGFASDRFGKLRMFQVLGAISIVTTLLITNLPKTGLAFAAITTTFFMVFNSGRVVPVFSLLTSRVPSRVRGRFMTLNSAVQQLGSGLGAFLSGQMVSLTSSGLKGFPMAGGLSVLSLVISMTLATVFLLSMRTQMWPNQT